jgi:hypothetical protein
MGLRLIDIQLSLKLFDMQQPRLDPRFDRRLQYLLCLKHACRGVIPTANSAIIHLPLPSQKIAALLLVSNERVGTMEGFADLQSASVGASGTKTTKPCIPNRRRCGLTRPIPYLTLPYGSVGMPHAWSSSFAFLESLRAYALQVFSLESTVPILLSLVTFFHSCIFPASTSIVSFLAGPTTAFCSAGSSILYQQCRIQTICTVHPPTIRMLSRSVTNSVLQMVTFGGRCPLAPWSQTHLKRVVIIRV